MINIENIRHPKEKAYYTIILVVSVIVIIALAIPLLIVFTAASPFLILIALLSWWASQKFKADIFGNSVHVNANQYSEIYEIAKQHSTQLGIQLPEIFITNSEGTVNAIAAKVFLSKYVILNSSLIDLMLSSGNTKELESIIGHELGHHAAGHLSFVKGTLLFPGKLVPFIGPAYSRACELTCDRIGYVLSKDIAASQRGLFAIALGSKKLLTEGKIESFIAQENEIPQLAAFFNKLFTSHPRTTFRITELGYYATQNPQIN